MAFDVEQLFQSVDIILTQRLQDVHFDKTIICTIVDDSDKKNGCYVVSDGTIRFKAYVSDATYRKDDQVRVSVLNGDFSEKKFITGRYTGDEDSSPITYKSPLESIIPITNNLVNGTLHSKNGVNGLKANSDTIQLELWRADLTSDSQFRDLQSNGIYNTLTMKADFKTLLSKYDLVSGNYGLRLDLFIQPSFDNPTQRIRKYVTLDSSEMMGNPYSFSIYSTQAKKVDIVSTGIISEMVLWLYQSINGDGEGRRFTEKNGNEIPVNPLVDDILVKNIEIGFGSDIEKVADNTLEIFTSSPPYYVYQNPVDSTNRKDMELLWYNKTDENQYIGFNDGKFDLDYDEIEYLKLSNRDARLCAQIGRDDIPSDESGLKLAADLKDAKSLMLKARDMLTNDVADVLYSLRRQVKNSTTITTELDKLLSTVDGVLVTEWNNANAAIEAWNEAYVGVLKYAYERQNAVNNPSSWRDEWSTDHYIVFVNSINSGIKKVNDFFNWLNRETQPLAGYSSAHRGNYDLYRYRTENELIIIEDLLGQIDELLNGNFEKLIAYHNANYKFYEYKIKDFSSYAEKYCIYWYQYEKGYKLEYQKDANNDEYNFGNFVGDGWRRVYVTDIRDDSNVPNYGLPREEDPKKPGYYPAKPIGQVLSVIMDRNRVEEKFMAVLFYNHEMYKSNVLTFTNSEPELIPNDALLDKRDALRIEHDVYSMEHYQAYNEFNMLRSLEDGGKVRQLKCFYDGLFRKDEALINAGLYWYVPNHSTMLTVDVDALLAEGFGTDAEESTEYSIPGYTYFYKKVGRCADEDRVKDENGDLQYTCRNSDRYFFYKIKPLLEKDAQNNTILVRAYLEGVDEPVEGEITMTFSTFGTNGTKYTLTIVPAGSQVSVGGAVSPLQLAVSLRDSQNNPIDIFDAVTVTEGNSAYGFTVESWKNLPNAFAWDILRDNTVEGSIKPITGLSIFIPKETIASWNAKTPYFGIINAKVNFKIDKNEDLEESQIVSEYQKYRVLDLNTLYAITYSSSDMFYMGGATCIVYNNQGVVSYVSEDKYELYTVNDKDNIPVPNQKWSIRYYKQDGTWIKKDHADWAVISNYMPILNSENRLTPAPLYIDNLEYVPVVICEVNDDIAWVQPIIVTQNRYASSTMNDWNGSFTIDEKNGTILSTAIGAGRKEEDNSFSGVLMGDIGKGMNFDTDNMDGLGLYGFNKGAQSFCLSSDGRAFFGKAGRGRIYFDGDSGTISSASYEMVRRNFGEMDAAGMLIDMDDGYIHMLGSVYNKESGKYAPNYGEGGTSQAEILISTGLVNNLPEAYLKIRSKNQTNKDHYLMYIDDKDYYLQTDNYEEFEFNEIDGEAAEAGSGFRLDLKDGILDAYNFKLNSKNIMINSSEKADAFFIIKNDDGKNLFYAGPKEYYIQSSDFETMSDESSGKGIKIKLTDFGGPSGIEAYNFNLRAGDVGNGDHAVVLSDSGAPYFTVNTLFEGETKPLIIISKNEQALQSSDFDEVKETGIRLDLANKELMAYSGFRLQAYHDPNQDGQKDHRKYIALDSNATDFPFIVNGGEATVSYYDYTDYNNPSLQTVNSRFRVGWNGQVDATGGHFNAITAENATLSGWLTVNGTITGGKIQGATIEGGVLKVGPTNSETGYQLYADSSQVTIKNANIINCSIQNGDGASSGTAFGVSKAGLMTGLGCQLTKGFFEECTITKLLTCEGNISFTGDNHLLFAGGASELYFGTYLTCSTGFSADSLRATDGVYTTKISSQSGDAISAEVSIEPHVRTRNVYCENVIIGTTGLIDFIKQVIRDSISISLTGTGVTDLGQGIASVSLGWSTRGEKVYSDGVWGSNYYSSSTPNYIGTFGGASGNESTTVTATLTVN